MTPVAPIAATDRAVAPAETRLREAAEQMESAFLAEMLKSAGVGEPRSGLGSGGAGETQFASFLVDTYADSMVERGGVGLSERLFQALQEKAS